MQYIAKLWLDDRRYLAVLDRALVIVTVDKDKNPVRYAIFEGEEQSCQSIQEIISQLKTVLSLKETQ